MDAAGWSSLPDILLVSVFSYLSFRDRFRASLVCARWSEAFQCPYLWKRFSCCLYMPHQEKVIKGVELYGQFVKSLAIELDQSVRENRENACQILTLMASQPFRRLTSIKILFAGENPYFYAGKEFVDVLYDVFEPSHAGIEDFCSLQEVDLSGLTVAYDDKLFDSLSAHHKNLRSLNIQNRQLVCKVSPFCVLRLVQRCRKITDLRIFNCSLSEDVLKAFTEDERKPLEHLSVICRREEKFIKAIPDEIWQAVVKRQPQLRVSLSFDHTCLLHKMSEAMKADIPVSVLKLETYTYIYDELRQAIAQYSNTLEKLVLRTPLPENRSDFNEAIIELAERCINLRAIHIFCVLEKSTVERILALHPHIKESKSYTLKYIQEPHPWIAGNDC